MHRQCRLSCRYHLWIKRCVERLLRGRGQRHGRILPVGRSGPLRVDVPKAGRKWEPQGLPRSEARVQATLHPWRKAPAAISSTSTLTIATALRESSAMTWASTRAAATALVCARRSAALDLLLRARRRNDVHPGHELAVEPIAVRHAGVGQELTCVDVVNDLVD